MRLGIYFLHLLNSKWIKALCCFTVSFKYEAFNCSLTQRQKEESARHSMTVWFPIFNGTAEKPKMRKSAESLHNCHLWVDGNFVRNSNFWRINLKSFEAYGFFLSLTQSFTHFALKNLATSKLEQTVKENWFAFGTAQYISFFNFYKHLITFSFFIEGESNDHNNIFSCSNKFGKYGYINVLIWSILNLFFTPYIAKQSQLRKNNNKNALVRDGIGYKLVIIVILSKC